MKFIKQVTVKHVALMPEHRCGYRIEVTELEDETVYSVYHIVIGRLDRLVDSVTNLTRAKEIAEEDFENWLAGAEAGLG